MEAVAASALARRSETMPLSVERMLSEYAVSLPQKTADTKSSWVTKGLVNSIAG